MKNKKIIDLSTGLNHHIWLVWSEPDDGTRYEYLVYWDGFDDFAFVNTKFTFKYPKMLNWWIIKDLNTDGMSKIPQEDADKVRAFAQEKECNPFTLAECIRTAKQMREEK